jgi:dihydroorotase
MNLLIRNVTIADAASSLNGTTVDALIEEGVFKKIGNAIKNENKVVELDAKGCFLSPGWFDAKVNFREPGFENKETIKSGQNAAAKGGFTGVLVMPSTQPNIQTRADVEYLLNKAKGHAVDVFAAGSLTVKREGKDMAEMFDMQQGGAIAFTDDKRAIADSGVMMRSIQYAGNICSKVIAFADDKGISGECVANESASTTLLGFKGSPSFAEAIALERAVRIAEYTGQSVHFSGISTREGVEVIRMAKAMGLPITAEVYVYHLLLDDSSLNDFNSNYKVKPPLRSTSDVEALKEAILDGTIDLVVSDHSPEDPESKDVEFHYAAYGMIGCESFYGVLKAALGAALSAEFTATLLANNPRKVFNLPAIKIEIGHRANFTLFNDEISYEFTKEEILSKSLNSPFLGATFKGKVQMTYNNNLLGYSDFKINV